MRFAMEEMPHVQTQIQNQTMSQNVTKEPKYVVQINLNLRKRNMDDPHPSTSSARQDDVDFVSLPFPNFNRNTDMTSKMISKSLVENGALGTKQQNASSKVMNHLSAAKKMISDEEVESSDLSEIYLRFNRMRQEQNFFKKMSGPNFLEAIIAKPKARLPDINDEAIDEYDEGISLIIIRVFI